jgi:hypothetical protein
MQAGGKRGWTASVRAGNLLNRLYFLFHPFPHPPSSRRQLRFLKR